MVLTANGNSNGSGTGKSATSAGNVYLSEVSMSTFTQYTNYQLWYIEEVQSQQVLSNGTYRITNDNDKFMTLDVTDDYNVCQTGDPRKLHRTEWGKSLWRARQLWHVEYLHSGYYLISPYIDSTRKLAAFGDYESLSANVYVTFDNVQEGSWSQRQQWKIISNVDGAYRIVSKGDYNTQAITVEQGDIENYTNIQMAPFYNAPGQRWSFSSVSTVCSGDLMGDHVVEYIDNLNAYRCMVCDRYFGSNGSACSANSVDGHVIEYVDCLERYKCFICGCSFESPEVEDFDNSFMTPQDRALIYALQRAALHEQLEGTNEAFVQSCYRVIDMIRSTYDEHYTYDFSDANGNYVSPLDYTYTAATVNTRVEITLEAENTFGSNARNVIWTLGEELPFPFNVFSSVLLDYFEEYEWCSLTEAIEIAGCALVDGVLNNALLKKYENINKAAKYSGVLNAVVDGSTVANLNEEIMIQISLQSPTGTHNFSGIYRVTDTQDHTIYVVKESHSSATGQATTYEANEIDCIYYSSEGYRDIKPYDEIF